MSYKGLPRLSSFTLPLIVTPLPDGRRWRLVKPFTYHIGKRNSKRVIKVPKGFVTDFASVPQFLWAWFPFWGRHGKGAVIHDRLYETHEFSRGMSDLIFREAMIAGGTKRWKANLMYLGVRVFGYFPWHKKGVHNAG